MSSRVEVAGRGRQGVIRVHDRATHVNDGRSCLAWGASGVRNARRVSWVSVWRIGVALGALALAGCGGASSAPQGTTSSASSSSPPPTQVKQGTGAADLSWTPPTTAADGSTLLNLAGYDIYYGTNPSALTQRIKITNIGVTNYVVSGLSSGTWYFVVTAYTTDGVQSVPSSVVSKTVP